MDFQKMIDAMGELDRKTRGKYHLTLGKAIEQLETLAPTTPVVFAGEPYGPGNPHSYRGYYSDLAFESVSDVTAASFLADCRDALGATFQGYKGGDFVMSKDTPLWHANEGSSGLAIISAAVVSGELVLQTKEID